MKKSELWLKVEKILWEEWDPIGINDYSDSNDEYDNYVPSIIKLLEEDSDYLKIAKLLHNHANINMGLNSSLEKHIKIAKKLEALKR